MQDITRSYIKPDVKNYAFYMPEFKYFKSIYADIQGFYEVPYKDGNSKIDLFFEYMVNVEGAKIIDNWLLSCFYIITTEAVNV